MVERGELGEVEDVAVVLTVYRQDWWLHATSAELRAQVARDLGTAKLRSP